MFYHQTLQGLSLGRLIHTGKIQLGGNRSLKIYGTLSCASGKRMKTANRVFFADEAEARANGYRPLRALHAYAIYGVESNTGGYLKDITLPRR
ncbi:Ada metal-binding domain-containing protein [Chitinophaga sp. 22321]|uniref:Ada metal-binding domain-containing protein n=1 Tax=Chitinophaga TaxID=79328 RepID=UPI002013AA24|nr:Ada metal-binding domain-containing protein [Chitinophaga hostae]